MQMMKLSMNSDFRQAVTRAGEEMKKAGIDLVSLKFTPFSQ